MKLRDAIDEIVRLHGADRDAIEAELCAAAKRAATDVFGTAAAFDTAIDDDGSLRVFELVAVDDEAIRAKFADCAGADPLVIGDELAFELHYDRFDAEVAEHAQRLDPLLPVPLAAPGLSARLGSAVSEILVRYSCPPCATRSTRDGLFVYAAVAAGPAGLPARFRAPLATSGMWSDYSPHLPPQHYVGLRLAHGDSEMFARVAAAILGWTDDVERLGMTYGSLLGQVAAAHASSRPAIAQLVKGAPLACRDPLLSLINLRCKDPAFAQLSFDTSPAALLSYWRSGPGEEAVAPTDRDQDRIVEAARAVFANPRRIERFGLGEMACIAAIDVLGDLKGATADAALRELEAMLAPDERNLREWFNAVRDRRSRPAVRLDGNAPFAWTGHAEEYLRDVNRAIEIDGGARTYLEAKPEDRGWVIVALVNRARDGHAAAMMRLHAAEQLLDLDPEAALELADSTHGDPALAPLSRPLARFRTGAALASYLAELGLLDGPASEGPQPFSVPARLIRHETFNTETDQFPNRHDELLRRLALLVDGLVALQPVFDEIPPLPKDDDDDDDQENDDMSSTGGDPDDERLAGHYRLRAYVPGGAYEVISQEQSDWLDVPAVVGLLNRICADAKLDHRYLVVETSHTQNVCVVAGPERALARAVADGVLICSDEGAAAQRGAAFEAAVIRDYRHGAPS